jgi:hypothetical protein
LKTLVIVLVGAMAACEASNSGSSRTPAVSAQTVSAQNVDFGRYRTFAFRLAEQPPAPFELSARSFEVERRTRKLVAAELARKGYVEAEGKVDFLVRLSSGSAKQSAGAAVADPGGNVSAPKTITAGEIVVDAFDGSTSQQVWQGTAQAEIDPERINDSLLEAAVQRVLATFPARTAAGSEGAASPQPSR